ncbi:VWA domain-containing protein [Candidatus Gracilibacteria bacterium]|nr:VWA domain-containing protein [Candidatus Gracilibacteria bacterium]
MALIQEIYGKTNIWYGVYMIFLCAITTCFFVLLASPQQSESSEKIKKNGVDIEIVFDLSYSMIATDIEPSRIEVAKSVFIDFVSQLETDRVGLILFAGKPFQSVPLSYDYEFLKNFIRDMSVETIDQSRQRFQGTAIGDGLILASDVLSSDDSDREKVIILITDGEANRGVEPAIALKYLVDTGMKTYTIGVGKDGDNTIEIPTPFGPQKTLISGVDEEILKKIALETGGQYFRADSPEAFSSIVKTIAELEKKPLETEVFVSQKERILEIFILGMIIYIGVMGIFFIKKIRL